MGGKYMYCPQCKGEYRAGFTECADCQISLVSELPPSDSSDELEDVSLVEVLSTADQGEVALVKSLLETEDIPYFAQGELARAPIPVRFLVRADHVKRAREVLADFL